ncbi:MAG: hypothetical protein WC465_02275 [Patescibacteria group bacterium]
MIWAGVIAFYFIMKKYSTKEELANWKYVPILNLWSTNWGFVKRYWKTFIIAWFIVLIVALWWSLTKNS